jgi:hypothetical protein
MKICRREKLSSAAYHRRMKWRISIWLSVMAKMASAESYRRHQLAMAISWLAGESWQ